MIKKAKIVATLGPASRAPDRLREGKISVPVPRIVPVKEDAADAARLVAVLQVEIVVAP